MANSVPCCQRILLRVNQKTNGRNRKEGKRRKKAKREGENEKKKKKRKTVVGIESGTWHLNLSPTCKFNSSYSPCIPPAMRMILFIDILQAPTIPFVYDYDCLALARG